MARFEIFCAVFIYCLVFQFVVESNPVEFSLNPQKRLQTEQKLNFFDDVQEEKELWNDSDSYLNVDSEKSVIPELSLIGDPAVSEENSFVENHAETGADFISSNIESELPNVFSDADNEPLLDTMYSNEEADSLFAKDELKNSPEKEVLVEANQSNPDVKNLISYAPLAKQVICGKEKIALSNKISVQTFVKEKILITFAGDEKDLRNTLYSQTALSKYNITNIEGLKVGSVVLEGFLPAKAPFLKLFSQLIAKAKKVKEIHFVGFSLGGVYAIFAALVVRNKYPALPKPVVYTFGTPRVGDVPFAKFAMKQIRLVRATYKDDDVPRSPTARIIPYHWDNLYSHFGVEYWVKKVKDEEKTFICNPLKGQLESKICINNYWQGWLFIVHNGPYYNTLMDCSKK
ncbi:hypothetical protein G9A89_015068 [Geosiphon pyriformis]|nr:hypothetical protein G9A89_015068 [Geosiphon pyriformis]